MKKMILRLVLSGLVLIAILVMSVAGSGFRDPDIYTFPPSESVCQVYIKVEDPCCKGYSVYVDGMVCINSQRVRPELQMGSARFM
jgi:hypothetical protein